MGLKICLRSLNFDVLVKSQNSQILTRSPVEIMMSEILIEPFIGLFTSLSILRKGENL